MPSDHANSSGQLQEFVPDELLVKFTDAATESEIFNAIVSIDARIDESFTGRNNLFLLRLTAGMTPNAAMQQLATSDIVEASEPNFIYRKEVIPNDDRFPSQWALNNDGSFGLVDIDINAPEAWEFTTGSPNVYIGVIDTGIEYNNEDLVDNVWVNPGEIAGNGIDDDQNGWVDDIHGIDVVNNDSDPMDDDSHGTLVSGVIAAKGNNGRGIAGVVWQAKLISCKFLDSGGSGTTAGAISCLNYFSDLKDAGIDLIATNNSWGGALSSQQLSNAIREHRDKDILFVASAGNDGVDTDFSPHYPSGYNLTNIVSVAAIDLDGELADFSNFGVTTVDIAAPGVGLVSTLDVASYDSFTGTSAAAPVVTGVIALAKANDETLTASEIRSWLLSKGKRLDSLTGKVLTGAMARASLQAPDSDNDGMPNPWELQFGLNPQNAADANLDADADGLSNLNEFLRGSDPTDTDSDDDGLSDGDEVNVYQSDPINADSDADGLGDFEEVTVYGTNPVSADTDSDGLNDNEELTTYLTDPLLVDSDGDGLGDGWEVEFGFDPTQSGEQTLDSDADGLDNGAEFMAGTNPFIIDSDEDGITDGDEANLHGTDPASSDTDGDGMPDGWEVRFGLDPSDASDAGMDADGDGLTNLEEFEAGNDPNNAAAATPIVPWSNSFGTSSQAASIPIETDVTDAKLVWEAAFDEKLKYVVGNGELAAIYLREETPWKNQVYIEGIDLLTGRLNWKRALTGGSQFDLKGLDGRIAVVSAPAYSGNTVLILDSGTGRPSSSTAVSDGGDRILASVSDDNSVVSVTLNEILSVNAKTGSLEWREPLSVTNVTSNPPAMNDTYIVHERSGRVYFYNRSNGASRTSVVAQSCDLGLSPRLAIGDDNIAFAVGSCAMAIDLDSAQVLWEQDGTARRHVSVDDSAVYLVVNGELQARDPMTSQVLWRLENEPVWGSLITTATHIFAMGEGGVTAVNKVTRDIEWTFPMYGELALSDDGILIVAGEFGVTAFDVSTDRDADGMKDNWERKHKLNFLNANDGANDHDNDGLTNFQEYGLGSDPTRRDSDNDGLTDAEEATTFGSDVSRADSDEDGLSDGDEVRVYATNPLRLDTDMDGFSDADEINQFGSDPLVAASRPIVVRNRRESFESGMPADWNVPAGAPIEWSVQQGSSTNGVYSLASDPVIDRQTAVIEWSGYFMAGELSFDYRKAHLNNQTDGTIWLDGAALDGIDSHEWEKYRLVLSEGQHTIRWEFENRSRDVSNFFLIDNVRFKGSGPYGTNPNNILTSGFRGLTELDRDGYPQRNPIEFPSLLHSRSEATDLVVAGNHEIVIGESPFLYVYDPLRETFTTKYLGMWSARDQRHIAVLDDQILVASHGAFPGVIRLNNAGEYIGRVLDGSNYADLSVGNDGLLYGLRLTGGIVDRISPETFSILESIVIDSRAIGIAVGSNGEIVATMPTESLLAYDSSGGFTGSIVTERGDIEGGPVLDSNGNIFYTVRNDIWRTSAQLTQTNLVGAGSNLLATVTRTGVDGDADGIPDWWEITRFLNPDNPGDAGNDNDADGLTNLQEFQFQTNPNISDTDGDQVSDGDEVAAYSTNPLDEDSDADGLSDFVEIFTHGTDPNLIDTDGDELSDTTEIQVTSSDPVNSDSDGDGMWDGWEYSNGLDLNDPQDAVSDPDGDGQSNLDEFNAGTNILSADTDNDELTDGEEAAYFTNPLAKDSDDDWLHDGWEVRYGFNPLVASSADEDSDTDGFTDVDEFYQNTDPTVFGSRPFPGPWKMHQGNSGHSGYVPVMLDPRKLELAWEYQAASDVINISTLAIDADIVSASIENASGSKSLVGLDVSTGTQNWIVEFGAIFGLSAPATTGDSIYVRTSDSDNSALIKLDNATGNEQFRVSSIVSHGGDSPRMLAPTISAGDVFIPYRNESIASFRIDTGQLNWVSDPRAATYWTPAADQNFVYTGSRGDLAVLNRLTGISEHILSGSANADLSGRVRSPILDRFGRVFDILGGIPTAFDTESRSVAWRIETGDFFSQAAFASGIIYAIDSGVLVAIDSRNGDEIWRYSGPSAFHSAPLVTVNHVFASTFVETVAIDRRTGEPVWQAPKAGHLAVDANGTLYISGFYGEISALRESTDQDGDGIPDGWEVFYGLDANDPADAAFDPDGDNLTNLQEFHANTNPGDADTDSDGITDDAELNQHFTDPNLFDTDDDGIDDNDELTVTLTDPRNADTDSDGVSDGDEVNAHFSNPRDADSDGDGVSDFVEIHTGSDPIDSGSLPVTMGTFVENFESGTLPLGWSVPLDAEAGWQVTAGTEMQGNFKLESGNSNYPVTAVIEFTGYFPLGLVSFESQVSFGCCSFDRLHWYVDGVPARNRFQRLEPGLHTLRWEFVVEQVSPNVVPHAFIDEVRVIADRDGDEMSDEWESFFGLDPDDSGDRFGDADDDELNNIREYLAGTSPVDADSDDDGIPDGWEFRYDLNPLDPSDADDDPDGDGLDSLEEFSHSTSPISADSENDGMPDGWEVTHRLNPLRDDSAEDVDNDGVSNGDEYIAGTNPRDPQIARPRPPEKKGGGGGAVDPFLLLYLLSFRVLGYWRNRRIA